MVDGNSFQPRQLEVSLRGRLTSSSDLTTADMVVMMMMMPQDHHRNNDSSHLRKKTDYETMHGSSKTSVSDN